MATHYIDTSANLSDISWSSNDMFVIRNNATLTINSKAAVAGKYFQRIHVERGLLLIQNTSTNANDAFCIETAWNPGIVQYAMGEIRMEGELITLGTSDGTANQTFTHWSRGDWTHTHEVIGCFVENDDMYASDNGFGNDQNTSVDHLPKFGCDTGASPTLTFKYRIPPNGSKIQVPNILVTRKDNSTNSSITADNSDNLHLSKVSVFIRVLAANHINAVIDDCTLTGQAAFSDTIGLTTRRCLYQAWSNNSPSFRGNRNMTIQDCHFHGLVQMLDSDTVTMERCLNTATKFLYYGAQSNVRVKHMTYTDNRFIYTGHNFQACEYAKIIRPSFYYDDDYYSIISLMRFISGGNFSIEDMRINDLFTVTSGRRLLYFDGCFKSILKNTTLDLHNQTDNSRYNPLYEFSSGDYCGAYNCTFVNAGTATGTVVQSVARNAFLVNCDLGDKQIQMGGLNPILKNPIIRTSIYPNLPSFGGVITSLRPDDNQSQVEFNIQACYEDDETLELGAGCETDMSTNKAYFLTDTAYCIVRNNRNQQFRRIGNFIEYTVNGTNVASLVINYSIDRGVSWHSLDYLKDTETIPDMLDDFWLKVEATENHSDYSVRLDSVFLRASYDDTKPDYEPYFFWADIEFLQVPVAMKARIEVGSNPVTYLDNVTDGYIHQQLWRDSPEIIKVDLRKYGYKPYSSTNAMNDVGLKFYYTSYQVFDLVMTEAEALAVTGITIEENPGYFEHDLYWDYTLSCGGNTVSDAYHFMTAVCASFESYWGKKGLDWWYMLERDGESFKTVSHDGHGVRVINYGGNLSSTQSNSGELYIPIQYGNMTFTNLQKYSEVRIFKKSDMSYLGGKESTMNTYIYPYNWSGDIDVVISIIHLKYYPIVLESTLTADDKVIPVSQVFNKNYDNPVAPTVATNTFAMQKNHSTTFTFDQLMAGTLFDEAVYDTSHVIDITILVQPAYGSISVDTGNRQCTYTPNNDYIGGDYTCEFMPVYNEEFAGIITKGLVRFDVYVYYNSARLDNLLICGDSLMAEVFRDPELFIDRFEELYGRRINVVNKAVGGCLAYYINDHFDEIFDTEVQSWSGNSAVFYTIGTNDMNSSQSSGDWSPDMDQMYDRIMVTKQKIDDNFPQFEFIMGDSQFLRGEGDDRDSSTYWPPTKELVSETKHLKNGYSFWVGIDNTEADGKSGKCIKKAVAEINRAEFLIGDDKLSINQDYYNTRYDPYKEFIDVYHPNASVGAPLQWQGMLDGMMLWFEYGVLPLEMSWKDWYDHCRINISDSATIEDGYHEATTGYNTLDITNWNVTTSTSLVHPIYNTGGYSPWTFEIAGTVSIVDIVVQDDKNSWLWNNYREKAMVINNGETITITIKGLTGGWLYKFQAIGSSGKNEAERARGIMHNPTLNKTVMRNTTNGDPNNAKDNATGYWDFTLIPQEDDGSGNGTYKDTITLTPHENDTKTYLSAIKFYCISHGNA